jgi:hypothetical protein
MKGEFIESRDILHHTKLMVKLHTSRQKDYLSFLGIVTGVVVSLIGKKMCQYIGRYSKVPVHKT